jgi:hypothetical protein
LEELPGVDRDGNACKILETRMLLNLQGLDYKKQAEEVIRICKKYDVICLAIDATGHEQLYEELRDGLGRARVKKVVFTRDVKEELVLDFRMKTQERKIFFGRRFKHYQLLRKEMHDLDPNKLDHQKTGSSDLFWAVALAIHAHVNRFIQAKKLRLSIMGR